MNGDHAPPRELDIAIVGAGVGGLSAAIALKIAGFNVKAYEGASKLAEVGTDLAVSKPTILPPILDRSWNQSASELE